ncbi:MAG TPA: sensor histidine kinase [Ktedonobacterales bacterium]|nr:sensor histidine kinase [Ktedonobacterales bacterium]
MDSPIAEAARAPAGSLRSTVLLWLVWILWLPFFTPQILELFQSHPTAPRLTISLLGVVAFFALYLWVSWQTARSITGHALRIFPTGLALWAPVVGLAALAIGLVALNGNDWGSIFFYVSSGAAGWLPTKKAIPVIAGLALFIAVAFAAQGNLAAAETPVVFVGTVGAIVIAFTWSVANSQQLRLEREEMARAAAVSEERLRIARDLHDLLGHNLSLIALKSELARRLAPVDPARAGAEMSDIEQVARQALREVREAVASYRQPTLATELPGAREMLAAAGIVYHFEGQPDAARGLPSTIESALAWTVREGVTNVIRHSSARQCTVRVTRDPDAISIEVRDDGRGAPAFDAADAATSEGNGLRGLAERVAALGGSFAAGPLEGGGYYLLVAAPLAGDTHAATLTSSASADSAQKTIGASQA